MICVNPDISIASRSVITELLAILNNRLCKKRPAAEIWQFFKTGNARSDFSAISLQEVRIWDKNSSIQFDSIFLWNLRCHIFHLNNKIETAESGRKGTHCLEKKGENTIMNKTVAMMASAIAVLIAGCGSEPKFTVSNKIYPKPEKCDVLIFPMSKKDEVKEWYSKVKKIYPEYCNYKSKKNKAEMETDAIKRMHLISDYGGHLHRIKFDTIDAQQAIEAANSECIAKNRSFCDKVKENGAFSELLYDYQIEEFEKVVPKYKEPIVLFAYASVPYGDLTILRAWYLEYSPGKAVTWTLE